MKSIFILLVMVSLLYSSTADCVKLVVGARKFYHVDGRGSDKVVNLWNTETGIVAAGEMIPAYFRDEMTAVAVASDHRLYFAECSERVPEAGTGFEICVPKIKRVEITVAADGSVSHGPEETIYRAPTPFTVDEWINELRIEDIAIRRLDDAGNYRVYFSTGGCGSCDAEPRIYYLDDAGVPHLYYTVPRDGIGVSSCEGLVGHWGGNFDFDADGELYLSSGNHIPAGLFHVPGAGADGVTGTPTQIDERTCGGILDFIVDGSSRLYFVGHHFEPIVYERDPETDAETVLLEIPLDFLDPPLGPLAGIWMQDIDKMFAYVTTGGDPPLMRGPAVPSRAFRLPHAEARIPRRPFARFEGSLINRLPIPPRPDSKVTKPDLAMVGLETGKPLIKRQSLTVPFRVFIRNNGASTKQSFNIAVTAKYPGTKKPVKAAFFVHGQRDRNRPQLSKLTTGEVMALGGILMLKHPRGKLLRAKNIAITADVVSCPDQALGFLKHRHCRNKESNEKNNRMTIELQIKK